MIKNISVIPALNSRAEWTIKVILHTQQGKFCACAPCGKSKGRWESAPKSYQEILKVLPEVKKALVGFDESDFDAADQQIELICGRTLENCGKNFTAALSMALARAAFRGSPYKIWPKAEFPYPIVNVAGGGAHMGSTAIQEFLILPPAVKTFEEAVAICAEIWKEVGKRFSKVRHYGRNDEGAWITGMDDIKTLDSVCEIAGQHGAKVGIDVAGSQIFIDGKYRWAALGKAFEPGEQLEFIRLMAKKYNLFYIEDPFCETDIASFAQLTKSLSCLVCGDDLYASEPLRISRGGVQHATNAAIIKIDQAGTVSRALRAIDACKNFNIEPVVSHRSGETCDSFIADFSLGSKLIKCGIGGGERAAKLNRLIELWRELESPRMVSL